MSCQVFENHHVTHFAKSFLKIFVRLSGLDNVFQSGNSKQKKFEDWQDDGSAVKLATHDYL